MDALSIVETVYRFRARTIWRTPRQYRSFWRQTSQKTVIQTSIVDKRRKIQRLSHCVMSSKRLGTSIPFWSQKSWPCSVVTCAYCFCQLSCQHNGQWHVPADSCPWSLSAPSHAQGSNPHFQDIHLKPGLHSVYPCGSFGSNTYSVFCGAGPISAGSHWGCDCHAESSYMSVLFPICAE